MKGSTVTPSRLILLPGLGADSRQFDPVRKRGIEIETPPWLLPGETETIREYAFRIGQDLDLDPECIVGGCSFGGTLAALIASQFSIRAVVIISSSLTPSILPRFQRTLRALMEWTPDWVKTPDRKEGTRYISKLGNLSPEQSDLFILMAQESPMELVRGGARMTIEWTERPVIPCPVHHIHGEQDRLVSYVNDTPDTLVPGAGHLLPMTHPDEVAAYLRKVLAIYSKKKRGHGL